MNKAVFTLGIMLVLIAFSGCGSSQPSVKSSADEEDDISNPFEEADALKTEAMNYESEGNVDEALHYYLSAADEYEKIGDTSSEDWGYTHYYIGLIYKDMDDPATSAKHFGRSGTILKKALGPDDPMVAQILTYKGVMEKDNGDIEEAMESFDEALRIREQEDPPDENQIRILKMNINDIKEGW